MENSIVVKKTIANKVRYINTTTDEYVTHMMGNIKSTPEWSRYIYHHVMMQGDKQKHPAPAVMIAYDLSPNLFYYFIANGIGDNTIDIIIDEIMAGNLNINRVYFGDTFATAGKIKADIDELLPTVEPRTLAFYPITKTYEEFRREIVIEEKWHKFHGNYMPLYEAVYDMVELMPEAIKITPRYYRIGFLCNDDELVMSVYSQGACKVPMRQQENDIKTAIYFGRCSLLRRLIEYDRERHVYLIPYLSGLYNEVVAANTPEIIYIIRRYVNDPAWCNRNLLKIALEKRANKTIEHLVAKLPVDYTIRFVNFTSYSSTSVKFVPEEFYDLYLFHDTLFNGFDMVKNNIGSDLNVSGGYVIRGTIVPAVYIIKTIRFLDSVKNLDKEMPHFLDKMIENLPKESRDDILIMTYPSILIDEGKQPYKVMPTLYESRCVAFADISAVF